MDEFWSAGSLSFNARKIVESTPPEEGALIERRLAELEVRHDEVIAEMKQMSRDDWCALAEVVAEAEREILRERGIEPD